MKKNEEPDLKEFRFHYHYNNSVECSDKYFMALDYDEAKQMFEYACCKRHLHPHLDKLRNGIAGKQVGRRFLLPTPI